MRKIFLILLIILLFFNYNIKAENNIKNLIYNCNENKIIYHEIDSKEPGPTIIITGGIHGDEPAGSLAAQKLTNLKPNKGKLYIFPSINKKGLKNNNRYLKNEIDLNRSFPGNEEGNAGEKLAARLFMFIDKKADMVIDLHESKYFAKENSEYFGQSIIAGQHDRSIIITMNVVSKANEEIDNNIEEFIINSYPAKNSMVWAVDKYIKIPSFMVETSKQMSLEKRVNYHIQIVKLILEEMGVKLNE
jgi:predicted deacylase